MGILEGGSRDSLTSSNLYIYARVHYFIGYLHFSNIQRDIERKNEREIEREKEREREIVWYSTKRGSTAQESEEE